MKNILTFAFTLMLTFSIQAQNTNVTDVTKKTVTTTKDSDGTKQVVKEQNTRARQNIELENADSKSLNKDLKASPVELESTTTVTNPDGTTRTVAEDRSATYEFNGINYTLSLDPLGYVVTDSNNAPVALLRATTNNTYIYRTKDSISLVYFDIDGNMILESYDDRSDKVITRKLTRLQR